MVVRIRFGRGPRLSKRKFKNARLAWLAAVLLTLISVSCLSLGIWKFSSDFGWAAEFVFQDGSLASHWQVWLAASLLLQALAWRLDHYGKPEPGFQPQSKSPRSGAQRETGELTANV